MVTLPSSICTWRSARPLMAYVFDQSSAREAGAVAATATAASRTPADIRSFCLMLFPPAQTRYALLSPVLDRKYRYGNESRNVPLRGGRESKGDGGSKEVEDNHLVGEDMFGVAGFSFTSFTSFASFTSSPSSSSSTFYFFAALAVAGFGLSTASNSASGSVLITSFFSIQPRRAVITPYFIRGRCVVECESVEITIFTPRFLAMRRWTSFRSRRSG